jgi:hypothetical protein
MLAPPRFALLAAVLAVALSSAAIAEKTTVCTITVNSGDERDTFRQSLPEDKYEFVELVERGRPDWLAASCRKKVACDVLVVSGHFAGNEFYTSKFDRAESLPVDELERVPCSDSCPDLFAKLKEVYLFGCDTLKPEPVKSATPEVVRSLLRAGHSKADAQRVAHALSQRHAESSRDRMRRIFPNVPVIYGFSSLAPYGRVAGPMLKGYFRNGPDEQIGSGRVSEKLLRLFGPSSMVATRGLDDNEPQAAYRTQACRFYDDRLSTAQKLTAIHGVLRGEMAEVRMSFDRVEKFFAGASESDRADPAFSRALADLAQDRAAREGYLAIVRDTEDPALRVRMIALARTMGWLSADEQRAELAHAIHDVLARGPVGFGEVDLICSLNKDRDLDAALQRVAATPARHAAHAAALACLGSADDHARVMRALAASDEGEVQAAQAYLRHRPITDAGELRAVALAIARMKGSGAQVRALETLARLHITDREVLDELAALFAQTVSLPVQRAIAEVFIRSGADTVGSPHLLAVLRQHRLRSPQGPDLIDALISKLQEKTADRPMIPVGGISVPANGTRGLSPVYTR